LVVVVVVELLGPSSSLKRTPMLLCVGFGDGEAKETGVLEGAGEVIFGVGEGTRLVAEVGLLLILESPGF